VPVVVKLHGSMTYFGGEAGEPVPEPVRVTERQILHGADAVASVSAYTAGRTAVYLDYDRPIKVLYNGIALSTGPEAIPKDPGQVIFTGSLMAKKGIYQLMKAWNLVHARLPQARLVVYGKGPVRQISALLGGTAAGTVDFRGHVSREVLFGELRRSYAAVFPSYAECFALAPMEAMACGTAVLYTTRNSGAELITHGRDGLLADPDDVTALAEGICYLLEHPGENARLAAAGRQRIEDHFRIEVIAAVHAGYYKQVIEGRHA
jgi:glycosyltransferase involved in cell wall biosynthesis